uniref:Uncharacterized protein n=1 Tax=Anopheles funestus TaxID=62324 RepID=A0A4Y0BKK8_ANOFN
MVHERLQKDLHNAKMSVQGATPQNLMESIIEETQVLEFMVQQKLPQELHQRRSEVQTLQEVIDEPNITRGDLQEWQQRVDEMNREIQRLVEVRLAEYSTQNDTLGPFRQQAAMVARNKEAAAEQLDQMTKELREVERQLQDRQRQLQETIGEVILRGEDLKQFVSTLRAKSNVYKQQRAELAAVKAEVNDLTQTLENLKSQDPSLSTALSQMTDDEVSSLGPNAAFDGGDDGDVGDRRTESPITGRGMTELARLVDGLQRAVGAARERVTPLSQQLRPLRERVIELKDEMDSKKQTYDALIATLNAESATMQSKITETERAIRKLEQEWQELQMEHERSQLLLEKANEEMSTDGNGERVSLKETLSQQILEQETTLKRLTEEKALLLASKNDRAQQLEMWTDLKKLFEVKIRCLHERKQRGPGGTLSVSRGGAETFTLQ